MKTNNTKHFYSVWHIYIYIYIYIYIHTWLAHISTEYCASSFIELAL